MEDQPENQNADANPAGTEPARRTPTRAELERIIHGAAATAAAVGGFSVLPGTDAVFIMPVQVTMVVALARAFDVRISKTLARSVIYASFGQILGRASSRILVGLVPGVGNVVRAGVAFGVTQAIGWSVVDQLEHGDFD